MELQITLLLTLGKIPQARNKANSNKHFEYYECKLFGEGEYLWIATQVSVTLHDITALSWLVYCSLVSVQSIISFLTMEYQNQTLQYFLEARGILHSTLPREYTD